ncbi:hypothetical protein HP593_004749 [Salmonella enterica]|nr:hypothetical protein [Salmonella enterica]
MVEIAWRTLTREPGVISTYGVKLMSDKIKRYPDDDALNKFGGGSDKNTSNKTVAIEPLSSNHKPCVIPKLDDKGKDSGK